MDLKKGMSRWDTEVRFQTFQWRHQTYFIFLRANFVSEPWSLYAALEAKGFVKTLYSPKDKEGYISYRFSKRGKGRDGSWTASDRRSIMRTAIGTLRKFGFDNVRKEMINEYY